MDLRTVPLLPGRAEGRVLLLSAPLSFWGGVDPASGVIHQPRHPQSGECLAGRVLALPATIGSSSSSSVMLELIAGGRAPAALLLAKTDAILLLGAIVARELGMKPPPAFTLGLSAMQGLPDGGWAEIDETGAMRVA